MNLVGTAGKGAIHRAIGAYHPTVRIKKFIEEMESLH
jgi:hypothetical protein